MNGAFQIAGVGLDAQQRALDIIANNITNLNTQGFKRSDVQFSELVAPDTVAGTGAAGLGVATSALVMTGASGELQQTGLAMDLAIDGLGFVEVMGPRGQQLLWRGGRLSVGDNGELSTVSGLPLRSLITVPLDASSIEIRPDGVVIAQFENGEAPVEIGQIDLVRPEGDGQLTPVGNGFYQSDSSAMIQGAAGEDGMGQLVQGSIERSNVDLNAEMVQLLIIQRAYAANAQMVQAADQIMGINNNLRGG